MIVTADATVSGTPAPRAGVMLINGEQWNVECSQIVQEGGKLVAYKSLTKGGGGTRYMKLAIDVEPGISTTPIGGISATKTSVDKCGAGSIQGKGGDGVWIIQKKDV